MKVAALHAAFLALPLVDVRELLQGRRAMILAPHADDESLGCGGLIAAACEAGLAPLVVVLTDGAASHPGSRQYPPARLRGLREAEAKEAGARLGLPPEQIVFLRYPDTRLPASGAAFETACTRVARLAEDGGCETLVAPWEGDPHCDHEAAALIAKAVAGRCGLRLLSYPVWGWLRDGTDVVEERRGQGWRLDISRHLAAKQRAIAAHASQYGDLITDCPDGFRLPAALLGVFARPFEVFIG